MVIFSLALNIVLIAYIIKLNKKYNRTIRGLKKLGKVNELNGKKYELYKLHEEGVN